MDFQETLAYLYARLPMFSRIGSAAYKPDLGNIAALSKHLGYPEKKIKTIHIAGSNGKGSCSHMLAAILQTAGYKTALYTSPHLLDFRERIRINGDMISQEWVIHFVDQIQNLIEEIQPSFFEVTVVMAFCYFAEQEVDIAIIEVGLGGRFDSTNIITPELSVITSISYDHTNLLGNTLEEIAFQKAGIIKDNVPVVIGLIQDNLIPIFANIAMKSQSKFFQSNELFEVKEATPGNSLTDYKIIHKQSKETIHIQLDLQGSYQQKNILTVLTCVQVLNCQGWHLQQSDVCIGLRNIRELTKIRGRFEKLRENPLVIADVAHNEEGLLEVFNQIIAMDFNQLHIVTGFVNDKDIEQVLKVFPKQANYYFTKASIPRALSIENLREVSLKQGLIGEYFEHSTEAAQSALASAKTNDIVLITGSFFILAEILPLFDFKKHIE